MVSAKPEDALGRGQALVEAAARCGELTAWVAESLERRRSSSCLSADIQQEATLLIWTQRGQFRGESKFKLRAWISRIVRRTSKALIERDRAHRCRFLGEPSSEFELHRALGDSAEEVAERREAEELLLSAVDRLLEPLRTVVILSYVENMPMTLVAETLGKSRSRTYKIRERALFELREELPAVLDPGGD